MQKQRRAAPNGHRPEHRSSALVEAVIPDQLEKSRPDDLAGERVLAPHLTEKPLDLLSARIYLAFFRFRQCRSFEQHSVLLWLPANRRRFRSGYLQAQRRITTYLMQFIPHLRYVVKIKANLAKSIHLPRQVFLPGIIVPMRRLLAVVISILVLFGYAVPALAYDVSYSYPSASSTVGLTCPANSSLKGDWCYCNSGFKVSGTQCVKDETMPPGTYEIYDDIRMQVTLNDDMTCNQFGIMSSGDMDMCQRYKATPLDKRDQWKTIPRPLTPVNGIENPWAPASQQTLVNGTSQQVLAPLPPPPPPPPPAATTTPATSTPEVKPADMPPIDKNVEKAREALTANLPDAAPQEKPPPPLTSSGQAATNVLDVPQNPPSDQNANQAAATASAAPQSLIDLSVRLAAAAEAATPPNPVPVPPPADPAPEPEPEASPGFFARIIGFFQWLF